MRWATGSVPSPPPTGLSSPRGKAAGLVTDHPSPAMCSDLLIDPGTGVKCDLRAWGDLEMFADLGMESDLG